MPVIQPYSRIQQVKGYIRNVVGITDTAVTQARETADSEIEGALGLGNGVHIDDTYQHYKLVQEYTENRAACILRKMFGDTIDAMFFCDEAQKSLTKLMDFDTTLQTNVQHSVKAPLSKTYPSNPLGHRLVGKSGIGIV